MRWVAYTDWEYEGQFSLTAEEAGGGVELVFHGLDTVAAVSINGEWLGNTTNMFLAYRWQVSHLLTPGNHIFVITNETDFVKYFAISRKCSFTPGGVQGTTVWW